MNRSILVCSLCFFLTAIPSGQTTLEFSTGYINSSFRDQVYSPNIYSCNGIGFGLDVSHQAKIVQHTCKLNVHILPARFNNQRYPEGFDVYYHGTKTEYYDNFSSYYASGAFGAHLAYSAGFPVVSRLSTARILFGPSVSIRAEMVGLQTYCINYSLGVATSGKHQVFNRHWIRYALSVPLVSLVNRPAYVLFDNQIMENYETNWMRELYHVDKVTHVFSGNFYSADASVAYTVPLFTRGEVSLGYEGFFHYCAFPQKLLRINHRIAARIGYTFRRRTT